MALRVGTRWQEARARGVAVLSRHIGWVTWEDICEVLAGSPVFREPEFPRAQVEAFFRERCLLG